MEYLERLRQFRQEHGITQRQIAEAIGIDERQYWKYEHGRNEIPVRYLIPICKHFKIDANWLLGIGEDNP